MNELRGTGEQHGLPMRWSCVRDDNNGRFRLSIQDTPLGGTFGFDGVSGWLVDASSVSGALDLADLEELQALVALMHGKPLPPNEDLRLIADETTGLPKRLERRGREGWSITFEDFRERIPHRITVREDWLSDSFRVEDIVSSSVEDFTFTMPIAEPSDVTIAHKALEWRTTRRRLPLVEATIHTISSAQTGWFMLDTGSGSLAIDTNIAAALTLPAVGRTGVRTADGFTGAPNRRATKIDVGPLTIADPFFLELDMTPFSKALGTKLAGVLGYPIFRRALVTIDGDADVAFGFDSADKPWLPLRFEGGRPVVEATFEAKDGSVKQGLFAIDTGSASSVTVHAGAAPAFATRGGAKSSLRGLTGSTSAVARTIPWLALGSERFEEVDALFASSGAGVTGSLQTRGVIGSLGMGLLRDLTMTLDYAQRRVAFVRRKKSPLRSPAG